MPDTSINELLNVFVQRMADAVADRLETRLQTTDTRDELVDEPTMADIAKVSPQSLARRRKADEIPFVRFGRRVLYQPTEVLAALSSNNKGGDA